MYKVAVVTGSRAEYNILQPVLVALREDSFFALRLFVTGSHLSPEYGASVRTIEKDGFHIDQRVEILLSSDTSVATCKSMGLAVIGFAERLATDRPDLLFVLGDRYEIFSAVQAAMICGIPIAHLAGGDVTTGALDDAMRHCISKMSHLHLVTNEDSARRVRQLGEDPGSVIVVGSPAIDNLSSTTSLSREDLEDRLGCTLPPKMLLVTMHPVTLEPDHGVSQLTELLEALKVLDPAYGLIFTRPNADPAGRKFAAMIESFVRERPNATFFDSLGEHYWNVMALSEAVVGNSSSGLYEAPTLCIPAVNVGNRQDGRLRATSVFDTPAEREAIKETLQKALVADCSRTVNPYGEGDATARIIQALKRFADRKFPLKKGFHDVS